MNLSLQRYTLADTAGSDLRIHLAAWNDGQVALCRTILMCAPYTDDLEAVVRTLLHGAEERQARRAASD